MEKQTKQLKYVQPQIASVQLDDELMLNIPASGTTTPEESDSKGYLWSDWDIDDEGYDRELEEREFLENY